MGLYLPTISIPLLLKCFRLQGIAPLFLCRNDAIVLAPPLQHPRPIGWNQDPSGFYCGRAQSLGLVDFVGGCADSLADALAVYYINVRSAPPRHRHTPGPPLFTVWWAPTQMHTCRCFVVLLWGSRSCQKEMSVTATVITISDEDRATPALLNTNSNLCSFTFLLLVSVRGGAAQHFLPSLFYAWPLRTSHSRINELKSAFLRVLFIFHRVFNKPYRGSASLF